MRGPCMCPSCMACGVMVQVLMLTRRRAWFGSSMHRWTCMVPLHGTMVPFHVLTLRSATSNQGAEPSLARSCVQVDLRAEAVLVPIYGTMVPFHRLTWRRAWFGSVMRAGGPARGGGAGADLRHDGALPHHKPHIITLKNATSTRASSLVWLGHACRWTCARRRCWCRSTARWCPSTS